MIAHGRLSIAEIGDRLGYGRLRGGGRKRAGLHFRLKFNLPVSPIAEGFIPRMTAAAKRDRCSPSQVECVVLRIVDCELPFNAQWAILVDCDFHQVFLPSR